MWIKNNEMGLHTKTQKSMHLCSIAKVFASCITKNGYREK